MTRFLAPITLIIALVAILVVPLLQVISGIPVHFMNGLDEGSYLQYDFARLAFQHYWRPSQILVVWLHQLGLSGGEINFVFDLIALIILPLCLAKICESLGLNRFSAWSVAFSTTFAPLFLLTRDPLVESLWRWHISTGAVSWFTMPHSASLPILRSPEPQVSYLVALFFVLLAIKRQRPTYTLLLTPFMYSFLVPPFLFINLTLALQPLILRRGSAPWKALIAAMVVSATVVTGLLAAYFNFWVSDHSSVQLASGHRPLVSFCGLAAVPLLFLRGCFPVRLQDFVVVSAVSLWVGANQQIVSGYAAQPSNIEQYFGVPLLVFFYSVLVVSRYQSGASVVRGVAVACVILSAIQDYQFHERLSALNQPEVRVLETLKSNPEMVVAAPAERAVLLDLIYPRQGMSAFSVTRVYLCQGRKNYADYACVRTRVRAKLPGSKGLEGITRYLDEMYRYEGNNYLLNTLAWNETTPIVKDVEIPATQCAPSERDLIVVLDENQR